MKILLKSFAVIGLLSIVSMVSAIKPTKPTENNGSLGAPLGDSVSVGKSPTGHRCKTWVAMASTRLRELFDFIENRHKKMPDTKSASDKYKQQTASDIKNTLNEVRKLIANAEKEADWDVLYVL